MAVYGRIEIDSRVMLGEPVIRGTRAPVELLLRRLSEGTFEVDLRIASPHLEREGIRAALAFAASEIAQTGYVEPTAGTR